MPEPGVTIEAVPFEEKAVLRRLLQLYLHDMSEFTGEDVDSHGEYGYRYFDHYWAPDAGEERYPMIIRAQGALAGFALVRKVAGEWHMAEFFVMRKYRGAGVGREAASQAFARFPGGWFVHELERNHAAQRFWLDTIRSHAGNAFTAGTDTEGTWQRFVSA